MISVNHIYKSFGDNDVLKDISTEMEQGQCSLIIGKSGAGKTVLLKCMVGLIMADQGEILYNGRDFMGMSERDRKKLRIEMGMLFQGNALFDSMTVEENVRFPLDMFSKMTKKEKQERVDFCLDRVHLVGANDKYPSEISGGMMKRVGIARAIVLEPKYLFCDEPNSGLDPKTSIVIDELIKEITTDLNITTVINTHDMNSVMGIGDKVIYLHQGEIHWVGPGKDVIKSDNAELDDFVFASPFLRELKEHHGE